MKYRYQQQLVLQFPGNSLQSYEALIEFEDGIIAGIGSLGEVDGHDMGVGEMNIFVHTDHPKHAFARIRSLLDENVMRSVKAAYREVGKDEFMILYPPDLDGFAIA